ncbi:hypothetical protein M8997_004090 [Phyllobacterium sp. 21LDTY02-6]|uniref:hypothetical protein n=1 Tax=Phyllobacterium sp. 21LDTY02-6 TaxID=2944903 RepID=UPI00201FE78D|nr:hypothetical protein [Phyllobacterium sp. 21LDTY02-6]MCO4316353.1 hypothetical protein [Phyllobacterium sp. 21LDTY02-6]
MAIKPDYDAGTVSVAANGTVVTGTGTLWAIATIGPGDTFKVKNLDAVIASVDSNTQITLIEPWTGGALTDSAYRIRFQSDGSRFTAVYAQMREFFSGGSVAALQALTGAADKLIYFTGAGTMALADFGANARSVLANAKAWLASFAGLTMAADQLPYGTGANTMALTPITAQARSFLAATSVTDQQWALGISEFIRTLLDDPNASAAQTTLGISAFAKTLLDDANAAAAFATLGGSSGPGWVRLPGGLLVQWGTTLQTTTAGGGVAVALPTAYSSASSYSIIMQQWRNGSFTLVPQIYEQGFPTASAFYFLVKQTHLQNEAYANSTVQVSWVTVGT